MRAINVSLSAGSNYSKDAHTNSVLRAVAASNRRWTWKAERTNNIGTETFLGTIGRLNDPWHAFVGLNIMHIKLPSGAGTKYNVTVKTRFVVGSESSAETIEIEKRVPFNTMFEYNTNSTSSTDVAAKISEAVRAACDQAVRGCERVVQERNKITLAVRKLQRAVK